MPSFRFPWPRCYFDPERLPLHDFFFFPFLLLDKAKELLPMFCDNSQTISQRSALPYVWYGRHLACDPVFRKYNVPRVSLKGQRLQNTRAAFPTSVASIKRRRRSESLFVSPLALPTSRSFLRRPHTRDESLNKSRANACPFFTGLLVGELRTF